MCLFSVLLEIPNKFHSLPDYCLRQLLCVCFLQPDACDPALSWCPVTCQKQFKSPYEESSNAKTDSIQRRQGMCFPEQEFASGTFLQSPNHSRPVNLTWRLVTDESLVWRADRGPASSLTTQLHQDT